MAAEPIPDLIRGLLAEILDDPSLRQMDLEQPLEGVVDSFALIELLTLLEQRLGVVFRKEHLTKEHWQSVASIATLVVTFPGAA